MGVLYFFAAYFFGALVTAYICGRCRIDAGPTTANIIVWPLALPVFALMWAYSKGFFR